MQILKDAAITILSQEELKKTPFHRTETTMRVIFRSESVISGTLSLESPDMEEEEMEEETEEDTEKLSKENALKRLAKANASNTKKSYLGQRARPYAVDDQEALRIFEKEYSGRSKKSLENTLNRVCPRSGGWTVI